MNWSDIAAAAATLFFVMDPLGNIPVFNSVLSRFAPRRRAQITARELVIALVIMLVLLFAGTAILDFLGLSQPSLNIAGGVLLFIIALRMIFPGRGADRAAQAEDEPFIVPLAMPMVAGPSTIAVLLLLSSTEPERIWEWCTALVIAWTAATVLLDGLAVPDARARRPRPARDRAPHGHAARAAGDADAVERRARVRAVAGRLARYRSCGFICRAA